MANIDKALFFKKPDKRRIATKGGHKTCFLKMTEICRHSCAKKKQTGRGMKQEADTGDGAKLWRRQGTRSENQGCCTQKYLPMRSTWALTPTAALHSSQRQATCYDGPREVEQEPRREKASAGRG